ncbi:hypothetical protein C9374_003806 [Naegleria lovaniensis]|uniref:Uncharacterized protein n=1 Tax=Naegleria lovaniensis TaxID=51637 RepID=A0AA88KSC2_NAELO|nr:uncharacterized protein C9374_003806 [Naegleria lovaniensis]KAG2394042.1 hypothetical protein C9374_003806 [Naegleria lovaniensis]
MYSRKALGANGRMSSIPTLSSRTSTPSGMYDEEKEGCNSEFSFSEYIPIAYKTSSIAGDEEYSYTKRAKFNPAHHSLSNRSRSDRNDIETLRESSLAAIRESQLTRMESEIGLIQFNLNELKREMMRLTDSSQQDRKTTQQLQQELRNADRLLKQLEEDEEILSIEHSKSTPNKKKTPIKTVKQSHDGSNLDEYGETERLIQDELEILKRIYADNLEFLLVVLKEMKFISSNSARMECLDFLSQIRKREECEIERLKSPKKNISFCGREGNTSCSKGNITSGDAVSVTTSLRVGTSSDAGNDDLESVYSEFDDNRSVNELMTLMNANVEELVNKLAAEKSIEEIESPVSKGDVIHLCREIYSLLNDMSVESDIEIINSCFDVLELYIGKALDELVQEDMVTDLMDILTTFLFFYRAVGRLLNQAEFVDENLQREFVEQRFEKLREKKDRDIDGIVRNRAHCLARNEPREKIDKQDLVKEDGTRSDDQDRDDKSNRELEEERENLLDNLMTIEELMFRDSLENDDNDTIETKEDPDDEEEKQENSTEAIVSDAGIVYTSPKTSSQLQSTPPKTSSSPSQQHKTQSLRPLGITVNEEKLREMMEKEAEELDMQFLLKAGSIKSADNNNRDYTEYASNYFNTN